MDWAMVPTTDQHDLDTSDLTDDKGLNVHRGDRELLQKVANTNAISSQAIQSILDERGLSTPEPARLRALGNLMSSVGADLLARAAELDGRARTAPTRVLIDARV